MKKTMKMLGLVAVFCFAALHCFGETLTTEIDHQLLVGQPAQSWEHRIDLPDSAAQKGMIFISRNLTLQGKLVIEREEFKPTYYYVKVGMPKHLEEPARGFLTIKLETSLNALPNPLPQAPTKLNIWNGSAARKPLFTWESAVKYSNITLLDVTAGKTIWERTIVAFKGAEYDLGFLDVNHKYLWAVRAADETGRFSAETQRGFQVIQKADGTVVLVQD